MDTEFLKTFVIVVEGGSIAEAARRLSLTPASVALRIRTLEKEFGARLLVRSGRTVMPTEAGRSLTELGRNLLHDVANLKSALTTETRRRGTSDRRGSDRHYGIDAENPDDRSDVNPGLEIQIVPGQSAELHSKVLNGEVDGAILIEPYFPMPKSCGWAVLREEPMQVIAPSWMHGRDAHDVLATEPYIRYGHGVWGGRLVKLPEPGRHQAARALRAVHP